MRYSPSSTHASLMGWWSSHGGTAARIQPGLGAVHYGESGAAATALLARCARLLTPPAEPEKP